ncbi:hypothetical protein CAPTEDRAFT_92843 [Capitella teleta]|uniref:Neurotransmitter-gated ion-channel ligand-binding domain-containing protein n=1 Tax=Capitella teleta TaxID=283909 RepID=R7TTV2_CAPTE|nr:hypothetical protein CAPTEDRAFT_92843 [Capitella teleta]|eukprot:ELT97047.1 hypothetical protein CAPTEDRAFT_92843 [Capitella teleta]
MSAEKELLSILLDNYDRVGRSGRPVLNVSTPIDVMFGLGLIQMDLNEKEKILTLSMWTRYQWRDEYLVWDPSKYDMVQSIRLHPEQIWIPDITLYNSAEIRPDARDALAVITFDGTVTWFPHTIFKSSCSVDVANFPFDSQKCHMWFGSWTHTAKEVNLHMGYQDQGIDLSTFNSDYNESCSWEIINVTAKRRIMPSEEDEPNFVVLTYEIFMTRKVVFSSYILTLPCIFFAFLTLVVFWLPPDRPDRTGLAMSTFSSFMLLLLILVETAPPTASSVPTLGKRTFFYIEHQGVHTDLIPQVFIIVTIW